MKRLIPFVFWLLAIPAGASHIVGGEFELLYLGNYRYEVNLILYFDERNGAEGNKDQDVTIYAKIFRKKDGAFMLDVPISYVQERTVNYTIPECRIDELETSRMFHSTIVTLSPQEFNDPEGYYIVWERCCRNYNIDNIVSETAGTDPDFPNPNSAGQTFYLEFPPVTRGGVPFVNSSPQLFPPLSDFGCPNKSYYADFAGTDTDGDSLVYSIVTPWDTHSHNAYPPVSPAPFPEVTWVFPYSATNVMDGDPDINITKNGFLTVTPTRQGLFVFAVKCEEFRYGVRIGEVRRDFQLYVIDNCPSSSPPQILGAKKVGEPSFSNGDAMNVSFDNTVSNENRCIEILVSDTDATREDNGFEEKLSVRVIPLNFKADLSAITLTPGETTLTNTNPDDIFRVCFPECPYLDGPYQIGVVIYDDVCSQPLTDTLKVTVDITPPFNAKPVLQAPVTDTLEEGDALKTWTFTALDGDNDVVDVRAHPDGFFLEDYGMSFSVTEKAPGQTVAVLTWDPECNENFRDNQNFKIRIIAEDHDPCTIPVPVTVEANLSITLFENTKPELTIASAQFALNDNYLHASVGNEIKLDLYGADGDELPDKDSVYIELIEATGDVPPYGYVFTPARGKGAAATTFTWQPDCSVLPEGVYENNYQFTFRAYDNRCPTLADTTELNILVADIERNYDSFEPSNIITPNGDHCNDYFAMEGIEPSCDTNDPDGVFSLPADNCRSKFEWITVVNRWGKQVFRSDDRYFRWYPQGESNGVYFYLLKFTDREFKGTITVRY